MAPDDVLRRLATSDGTAAIPTPFLALDLDRMEANIARMAAAATRPGVALRPHFKHHKCTEIARLQLAAGACGMTCATSDELTALVAAGVRDVLLANVVTDGPRLAAIARAALRADVALVVDSPETIALAAAAAREAGARIGACVELDVGMGRNGARTVAAAEALVAAVVREPALSFRGIQAYEGHLVDMPDADARGAAIRSAFAPVRELRDRLLAQGIEVPAVTGGASATATLHDHDLLTEIQAGTYVLNDGTCRPLLREYEPALVVVASVLTIAGEVVVLNVGAKRMATDWGVPVWLGEAEHQYTAEEHAVFHVRGDALPRVGDRVAILPAHTCTTMAMYARAYACRGGALERTLEIDGRDGLA